MSIHRAFTISGGTAENRNQVIRQLARNSHLMNSSPRDTVEGSTSVIQFDSHSDKVGRCFNESVSLVKNNGGKNIDLNVTDINNFGQTVTDINFANIIIIQ